VICQRIYYKGKVLEFQDCIEGLDASQNKEFKQEERKFWDFGIRISSQSSTRQSPTDCPHTSSEYIRIGSKLAVRVHRSMSPCIQLYRMNCTRITRNSVQSI
jgi:hypothetical protein